MKAIVDMSRVQQRGAPKMADSYSIKKLSQQEIQMQRLYCQLKQLVPNCSVKQQLSKKELLQNVIDYIFDLEDTLDLEPATITPTPLAECSNDSNKMDISEDKNLSIKEEAREV